MVRMSGLVCNEFSCRNLAGLAARGAPKLSSGPEHPVAAFRREWIVDRILPLDGTKICVFKKSGQVRVVLTAASWPRVSEGGLHWIERDENFSLQNLFGRWVKGRVPAGGWWCS
jgi:hypothetical protein